MVVSVYVQGLSVAFSLVTGHVFVLVTDIQWSTNPQSQPWPKDSLFTLLTGLSLWTFSNCPNPTSGGSLCIRTWTQFWVEGVGVLGVCGGGWEAVLGEHSGTELLCTVRLCSDTISHHHGRGDMEKHLMKLWSTETFNQWAFIKSLKGHSWQIQSSFKMFKAYLSGKKDN